MVEGELARAQLVDRRPPGTAGIRPGLGHRQVRSDREVGDADDATARIAIGSVVDREPFQMQGPAIEAGLLGELPVRRVLQLLAYLQESAGQGIVPLVGRVVPLDDQCVQPVFPDGQDGEVDGQEQLEMRAIGHSRSLPCCPSDKNGSP